MHDHVICEGPLQGTQKALSDGGVQIRAVRAWQLHLMHASVRRTAKLEAVAGGQQPDIFSNLFLNFD